MPASIVVASAARTPVGSFNGAFANTPAHELGAIAIKEVLARAGVEGKEVDEVILGQILTAAQGQNPARQAAIGCRHPEGDDRLGPQPALRLGPARHRASACSRSPPATPRSSSPAARNRCRWPRMRSICAAASRWATSSSSTR